LPIVRAKSAGSPSVEVWGTGTPRREFLHVDDLADACVHLMKTHETALPINVGTGIDVSILELAEKIKRVVGFEGALTFDRTKPDGTPRKLLDVSRLADLGWRYRISLNEGITSTYAWYREHVAATNGMKQNNELGIVVCADQARNQNLLPFAVVDSLNRRSMSNDNLPRRTHTPPGSRAE
jgi:dTDP-D-glucose 4,6-dehydratase